ncbi:MAG: PadR family transcriptional regulator [Spirochaetales bacterium]|nr:PadR family transcriptional regulator [Spirochaetales bacterium]
MAQKTRYAVLGVLSIEESSGYAIRKFLETTVSHFWRESFGQIYPILNVLEAEGAVVSHEEPAGGRKRRVYSIEPKGRDELKAWLKDTTANVRDDRNELLLKLFFCDDESVPILLDQIRTMQTRFEARLAEYRRIGAELVDSASREPGYRYWLATLEHGKMLAEAQIEWCDRTVRALGA